MINIFEVFVDAFTFGIYGAYKNHCILEKQYKEGNAKYVLGGERGTILIINETTATIIWGTPDSIEINGKNVCT